MRFVKLRVENMLGIERAEVGFGERLNVLHGPNDIGKSTLAAAIRAALLLPHASEKGADLIPWHGDHTPLVELTFRRADGVFHRVTKTFGSSTRGSAKLERSRDGVSFDVEATARQVDDKLRNLLAWGIPGPGGKGGKATRGLPEAFLAHVLLGEQTDVDRVLRESLEMDPSDSGRVRLTTALQAFATDPKVKSVLDDVQARVDALFTPSGQRKRGKGSPFLAAAEEVSGLRAELEAIEQKKKESGIAEERVRVLVAEVNDLRDASDVMRARLGELEGRVASSKASVAARAAYDQAVAALAALDAEQARVAAKAEEIAALATSPEARVAARAEAELAVTAADEALAAAKEALRRESSDEASAARMVARAEAEKRLAELARKKEELASARSLADEAARRVKALEQAEAARQKTLELKEAAEAAALAAAKAAADAEGHVDRLDQLVLYGAWADATAARARAAKAEEETARGRDEARALREKARALRSEAAAKGLPAASEVKALVALEREVERAEAALGGGVSVSVRPKQSVDLRLRVDGKLVKVPAKGGTYEAGRSAELSIAELVEVEILAGDKEKRRAAEELRKRWNEEGRPKLASSGLSTASELMEAREAVDARLREADALDARAASAEAAIASRKEGAQDLGALEKRIAELDAKLEGLDRAALAKLHGGLGAGMASEIERKRKELDALRRKASEERLEARARAEGLAGQLTQLDAGLAEAREGAKAARKRAGGEPAARLAAIAAEEKARAAAVKAVEAEIAGFDMAASGAVEAAKGRVAAAEASLGAKRAARAQADEALAGHRSKIDRAKGEHAALEEALSRRPRDPLVAAVAARRAEMEALPPIDPTATPEALEEARRALLASERALADKRDELTKAEGALTQVGGAVIAERHAELNAALVDAGGRQKELETDADAWRMLRDALKETESAGAKHVGRVLADDVTRRFRDLTGGKYGPLELGPSLETHGIHGAGTRRDIDVLSVGTREQLATLLRLAIAESLDTAIVLDDHLVQTDIPRLAWFVEAMRRAAERIQVIVLTCRERDYEAAGATPDVTWVDLDRAIKRWSPAAPAPATREVPAVPGPAPGSSLVEPAAFPHLLRQALVEMNMSPSDLARDVSAGPRIVQHWLDGSAVPAGPVRQGVITLLRANAPPGSARARAAETLENRSA